VVLSEPATHGAVQLKAGSATQRPATEADRPVLAPGGGAARQKFNCTQFDLTL
jgi:hypothetical protein